MIDRLILVAQRQMARVVDDAQALPFASYEQADGAELHDRLIPDVQRLLRQAGDAVRLVEHLAEHRDSFSHCHPQPTSKTVNELADLCFIVQAEVANRRAHLRQLTPETAKWALLVATERATVDLVRGLAAVEKELCKITGCERLTDHVDLLKDAIKGRAAVTSFRRSALRELDSLEETLKGLRTALSHLIGRGEFSYLRVSDRLNARNLLERLEELLGQEERAGEDCERLIQDIQAFAILLDQLNDREELVFHDAEVLESSHEALESLDPRTPLPRAEFQRLIGVFGRDDELDQLIVSGSDTGTVVERLQLLMNKLRAENEVLADIPQAV